MRKTRSANSACRTPYLGSIIATSHPSQVVLGSAQSLRFAAYYDNLLSYPPTHWDDRASIPPMHSRNAPRHLLLPLVVKPCYLGLRVPGQEPHVIQRNSLRQEIGDRRHSKRVCGSGTGRPA